MLKRGKYGENLIILHEDGILVLDLVDVNIVDAILIRFLKVFKVCTFEYKVIAVIYDSGAQQTIIKRINVENLTTKLTVLKKKVPIVSAF